MTDVLDRTGSYLGPTVRPFSLSNTTPIFFAALRDFNLAQAVQDLCAAVSVDAAEILSTPSFDSRRDLVATSPTFSLFVAPSLVSRSEESVDAVGAVEQLQSVTSLSVRRVLAAVGIRYRTFYAWKTDGRSPRLDSLGSLWHASEQLQRLQRDLGTDVVAHAFRVDSHKRALFERADFDGLALSFTSDRLQRSEEEGHAGAQQSPSAAIALEPGWMPTRSQHRPTARPVLRAKA
jgi:hypothetical protein